MLEMIDEECLKNILDTKKSCNTSLLYLETRQLPGCFHIQIMKLNFLKYILNQKKDSLVHKFLIAQCENPLKGDWFSSNKRIINEINLNMTFEEIIMTKNNYFINFFEKKLKTLALKYLRSKVKSKGKEIVYNKDLQCQTYLLPNKVLTIQEQRARMNILKNNYQSNSEVEYR